MFLFIVKGLNLVAFKGPLQSKLLYESVNPYVHKNMYKILQQNTKYTCIVHDKVIICETSPVCFVDEIFLSEFYETSTGLNSEDLDSQSQHISFWHNV